MDTMPNTTPLHPLLVGGDEYAGSVFAKMMCEVVVSVKVKGVLIDRRKNRGFPDEILKAIAAGAKPVSIEAIRQLLHDFYTHAPMSVGRGDKDYLLLRSVVEGTWCEKKEQRLTALSSYTTGFLQPTPAPASQMKVPQSTEATVQSVSRTAVQERAKVVSSPWINLVAPPSTESIQNRPLPRIVIPVKPVLQPTEIKLQQVVKIPKNDPVPVQIIPAPVAAPKSKKVTAKKVLKPSSSFHTMMKKKPLVSEKPIKQKSAPVIRKPKILKVVNPREDLMEESKSRFVALDEGATSRFWVNLAEVLEVKSCTIADLLVKIDMPLPFFVKLQDAKQMLTTTQVMRFARGLEETVERLLR